MEKLNTGRLHQVRRYDLICKKPSPPGVSAIYFQSLAWSLA